MSGPSHCGRLATDASPRDRTLALATGVTVSRSMVVGFARLASDATGGSGGPEPPRLLRLSRRPGPLHHPLLLPLGEDAPALALGFLERVLGRGGAAGRLGEHHVQDPRAVDLVDRRVGVPRIPDVGGPAEDVVQDLV